MLTKAIIKETNKLGNNKFLVYIPLLRNSNQDEKDATLEATLVSDDSISNSLKVGDVVFVDFEDNRYNKPVIQGKLFISNNANPSSADSNFRSLQVSAKTELNGEFYINGVKFDELFLGVKELVDSSQGLSIYNIFKENISMKSEIDKLNNKISSMEEEIEKLKSTS